MKGLDTPVLVHLLHGSPSAQALLKSLRGEELATTELNLYELGVLAAQGPRSARGARLKALAGLRRRISVLPIGPAATEEAQRLSSGLGRTSGYEAIVWGAMISAGCQEWITTKAYAPAKPLPGMKVRVL